VSAKRKSGAGSLVELVVIVAVALGLALGIQAFVVKPYRIPSPSMVPTLVPGQRVLVNRIGTHFHDPAIGDVVVFHPPAGATDDTGFANGKCGNPQQGDGKLQPCDEPTPTRSKENFIKRVVGLPGDRLQIRDCHVIRNGRPEPDRYIRGCAPGDDGATFAQPIVVPPDHYFMMGDNRGQSDDSRFWGPVRKGWVIGGAFATYWPPKRIGTI